MLVEFTGGGRVQSIYVMIDKAGARSVGKIEGLIKNKVNDCRVN